jgi:hypothetical protein
MDDPRLEINEVRLSLTNGHGHESRAERISRLTFEYVQELMERELQHLGSDVVIDHLEVPAVQVCLDTMDDETIARAGASGIYRALFAVL